ncbi:hypothetical protein [Paraburkholderia sp.]|uniref:hypothetical protein n=1 Tax=Paraburkholderia sp. TaxID=1926495 RepID=UPI0023965408|nr:hypothetical protein [Paraburkholderia sp.]MDE1181831.1 hypothetical protein [Paraburkholderia sp.]
MTNNRVSAPVSIADLKALPGEPLYGETVRHFVRRTGLPVPYVDNQVVECLRYLYLVSTYPDRLAGLFLPVEQPIDEIWHYLILQTREYRTLCEAALPGRFFIEHRSMPYAHYRQAPGRAQVIEQALRWLPLYRDTFGAFGEHALPHWTMVRFLHDEMGLSLDDIALIGTGREG